MELRFYHLEKCFNPLPLKQEKETGHGQRLNIILEVSIHFLSNKRKKLQNSSPASEPQKLFQSTSSQTRGRNEQY
ncbi:hypothetical protein LEP1GSC172_3738 [Leptospira noguchii]|uniref:Uncharacterized protein n=1 Tax=Leptospira noguchii TaxID=28182 RepID=M6VM65_9LEPT|nr:hypothetical protein LEP1GSC172_3738 [Leptospira noguchii]